MFEGVQVISISLVVVVVEIINAQTITIISSDLSSSRLNPMPTASTSISKTLQGSTNITRPQVTHTVYVGNNSRFSYSPNQLNASIGDTVRFNISGQNNSIMQSELSSPCTYHGGFETGLNQINPYNVSGKFVVDFQINASTPLWFYW